MTRTPRWPSKFIVTCDSDLAPDHFPHAAPLGPSGQKRPQTQRGRSTSQVPHLLTTWTAESATAPHHPLTAARPIRTTEPGALSRAAAHYVRCSSPWAPSASKTSKAPINSSSSCASSSPPAILATKRHPCFNRLTPPSPLPQRRLANVFPPPPCHRLSAILLTPCCCRSPATPPPCCCRRASALPPLRYCEAAGCPRLVPQPRRRPQPGHRLQHQAAALSRATLPSRAAYSRFPPGRGVAQE